MRIVSDFNQKNNQNNHRCKKALEYPNLFISMVFMAMVFVLGNLFSVIVHRHFSIYLKKNGNYEKFNQFM